METVTVGSVYLGYTISNYAHGFLAIRHDERFNHDRKLLASTIEKLVELIDSMEVKNETI